MFQNSIGDSAGEQMTVAVLVLEALAIQGGPARGRAEQKSLCLDVAREPHQIAHALKAEHRVINVKRNHVHTVRGVGRPGRDKG